jgi:hypothetical protein
MKAENLRCRLTIDSTIDLSQAVRQWIERRSLPNFARGEKRPRIHGQIRMTLVCPSTLWVFCYPGKGWPIPAQEILLVAIGLEVFVIQGT